MKVWTLSYVDGYYPDTLVSIHQTEGGAYAALTRAVDERESQHNERMKTGIYNGVTPFDRTYCMNNDYTVEEVEVLE